MTMTIRVPYYEFIFYLQNFISFNHQITITQIELTNIVESLLHIQICMLCFKAKSYMVFQVHRIECVTDPFLRLQLEVSLHVNF